MGKLNCLHPAIFLIRIRDPLHCEVFLDPDICTFPPLKAVIAKSCRFHRLSNQSPCVCCKSLLPSQLHGISIFCYILCGYILAFVALNSSTIGELDSWSLEFSLYRLSELKFGVPNCIVFSLPLPES